MQGSGAWNVACGHGYRFVVVHAFASIDENQEQFCSAVSG